MCALPTQHLPPIIAKCLLQSILSFNLQGVQVVLQGEPMMDFLEKLIYMVLPTQIGFEGTSPFLVSPLPPKPSFIQCLMRPQRLLRPLFLLPQAPPAP